MADTTPPLTNLEMARSIPLLPIQTVAERLGIRDDKLQRLEDETADLRRSG